MIFSFSALHSQEKSKKILDIWTKSNTFPSAVLTRLRDMVKEAEKGAYHNSHMCSLSIPSARVIPAIFARIIAANELRKGTEILLGFALCQSPTK